MKFIIDISEEKWDKELMEILLLDRTTMRNIIWATEDYRELGDLYNSKFPIEYEQITGNNINVIQPRVLKSKKNKLVRTKLKAEVFTPSWICNIQNNLIDNAWFMKSNVFNFEKEKSWEVTKGKIEFPHEKKKTWKNYVDDRRIEITCGEAPYIASRYDSVTGKYIELTERIGILDRKLRIVNENTHSESEWIKWSERAFQSTYGFEYQGDSLLIARENLLATFCDNMKFKFKRCPTNKELINIAKIISWNIWQMDGLTYTVPFRKSTNRYQQLSFFDTAEISSDDYCIIKDWRAKKILKFKDINNTEILE